MTLHSSLRIPSNFWNDKKIPALEYCKLNRAAHLLQCEVSDLLHWAEIGSIKLCVCVEDMAAIINNDLWVDNTDSNNQSLYWLIDEWKKIGMVLFPQIEFSPLSSFTPKTVMADPATAGILLEFEDTDLSYDFVFSEAKLPLGYLDGMWSISNSQETPVLKEIKNHGYCKIDYHSLILEPIDVNTECSFFAKPFPIEESDSFFESASYQEDNFENSFDITITPDDLYITRKTIEHIYMRAGTIMESTITGDIKQHSISHIDKFDYKKEKRIAPKKVALIMALKNSVNDNSINASISSLLEAAGIDRNKQQKYSETQLYHAVSNYLGREMPTIDPKTLSRWLKFEEAR